MQILANGVKKIEATDNATVENFNANADLLDASVGKLNQAMSSVSADTLVKRDSGGRFKAGAPVASDDVARKDTVDTAIANVKVSPSFTGIPTAPTAAVGTNTTQVATTAFVIGQASVSLPVVNGTASTGSATSFSRSDHVHPTDTSRAPLASPALTGTPTAPTATAGTNTTQIATTAFANAAVAAKVMNKITVSATAPSNPAVNDIWIVTT